MRIPTLTTERLTLRAPCAEDFEAIAAFRASERSRFVGGPSTRTQSWHYTAGLIGHWDMRGYGRWIVTETGREDTALGIVGIYHPLDWPEAEIGWTMFEAGEGRGLAFEAALASRLYAYETLNWTTIISLIAPDNARSLALGKRMGCRPDGQFVHETFGEMDVWRHPSPEDLAA